MDAKGRVTRWMVTRRFGRWVRLSSAEYAEPNWPKPGQEVELFQWELPKKGHP